MGKNGDKINFGELDMEEVLKNVDIENKSLEYDVPKGYESLTKELLSALDQASKGKGKERHATDEPFNEQQIIVINRWLKGSPVAGPIFQAVKKAIESSRMEPHAAMRELDGAIVYLCAAKILLRENAGVFNMENCKTLAELYMEKNKIIDEALQTSEECEEKEGKD